MNDINQVNVHPLVLLSISDHYGRSGKAVKKRVVGTLLGSFENGFVEITNCFAVPFEEDKQDEKVWYLDHKYHEKMLEMFQKVNAKENVVGWYSSGPTMKRIDIQISELYSKYCDSPVFIISNSGNENSENSEKLIHKAYRITKHSQKGSQAKTFVPIASQVKASDTEEIGIEQLLRNVRDKTVKSLEQRVNNKKNSVSILHSKLRIVKKYLAKVQLGEIPQNKEIFFLLQEIFNEPLSVKRGQSFLDAHTEEANDSSLILFISSLTKTVLNLAELVENQIEHKEALAEMREKCANQKEEKKEINLPLSNRINLHRDFV